MRVAAVQLHSGPDRDTNLARAAALVAEAAAEGAELVALPELFGFLGRGAALRDSAEPLDGPTSSWATGLAASHGLWLLAGSFVERLDGPGGPRLFNTSRLASPEGEVVATYRKIHLFDVEVPGAGLHESDVFSAGDDVPAPVNLGIGSGEAPARLGMTTCYDLRFPEPYRILALRGATVIAVPSAFTAATGPAHWEVLLRARAVENQIYVVAPDQCGTSADGTARHGHSMVVDPWGRVIASADAGDGDRVVLADVDLGEVARVRSAVPSLTNRRPGAYRWPS